MTGTAREKFAADLLAARVRLPVALSSECHATIIDADGQAVATVDVDRERPDMEAMKIALWINLAINTCGGFPSIFLNADTSAPTTSGGEP